MSGYIILLLMAVTFVVTASSTWEVQQWRWEAKQEAAVEAGIKDFQAKQAKINVIDTKSVAAQQTEQAKTVALQKELTDERLKKHVNCQHSANLRRLLHQASLPPVGLSR